MNRYRRPASRLPAFFLLLALAGAGAALWWLYLGQERAGQPLTLDLPVPVQPKEPAETEEAEKPALPKPRPKPAIDTEAKLEPPPARKPEPRLVLPLLDDSDPMVRDGFVSFTRHEGANAWLSPSDLVRRFVVVVHNVSLGRIARDSAAVAAPAAPFIPKQTGEERYEMDPASYERYNLLADVVASMDARRAAGFYRLLRPLLQEAYQELGYGADESFDDALARALERVLAAPLLEAPIPLVRPTVRYEFADPALEASSALRKQLIRMGPRNVRLLQRKARELLVELR